jgi:acyl-CoA thioesterase FadM
VRWCESARIKYAESFGDELPAEVVYSLLVRRRGEACRGVSSTSRYFLFNLTLTRSLVSCRYPLGVARLLCLTFALGAPLTTQNGRGMGFILKDITVRYKYPVTYPDTVSQSPSH